MKYIKTMGIVLARTNFGEADRILTFLTPDFGKLRVIAKAVRKSQSKLAGGIELFSITKLNLVIGRGELYTLTGAQMAKHYGNIVKDLDRLNAGYEVIRLLGKATEDAADPGYFILAENAFGALDNPEIDLTVANLWFRCRLIRLSGHSPNLRTNADGGELSTSSRYEFDYSKMAFVPTPRGHFSADTIKFLRLNLGSNQPQVINRIDGAPHLAKTCLPLADSIMQTFVRI